MSSSRVLPDEVRARMRAVADREASRLARPETNKNKPLLAHASRYKAAVTSTPSGYLPDTAATTTAAAGKSEEWCGPFTVARRLIEQRDEARRKREEAMNTIANIHPLDALMEQVEQDRKRKAHPSLLWKAKPKNTQTPTSYYGKRQKRVQVQEKGSKVPTLFKLCIDFLVDNFEHVEALGTVDASIRRSLSEQLVAKNKMDGPAFTVIAETGIDTLELIDCTQVTQDQLGITLKLLLPAGLQYLLLHHAGRCFGPKVVEIICSMTPSTLFAISIAGAYLLTDTSSAELINHVASSLSSVAFKACPLLKREFCDSIQKQFASSHNNTLLELTLEDLDISKDDLLLLASSDCLRNLKRLTLRQLDVDDQVVLTILDHVGEGLEGLDLSFNNSLTDLSLSGIRTKGAIRFLDLANLKNLTAAGLEALFAPNIPGLPSPPRLCHLHLGQCYHESVTDTLLDLVTRASSMKRDNGDITNALSSFGGLVYLNIQGSTCTDTTMEHLVARSGSTLKELDMSFSPLITDKGLGYLVSKCDYQLTKIYIWGCAQVTDNFLDGHERTDDSNLQIVGSWIKGKVDQ